MAKKKIRTKLELEGYNAVGVVPGSFIFMGKAYDLRKLNKEKAEFLVENKCPYIERIEKPSKSKNDEK